MLAQFRTLDESLWLVDTDELKWARVDKPPIKDHPDVSQVLDSGKLIPQGYGVFTLEGRTEKTPNPGEGLCSVSTFCIVSAQTVIIYLGANVEIKDFIMPVAVEAIRYEIIPLGEK